MSEQEKVKCYEAICELVARDEMFLNHDHETGEIIYLLVCNDTFGYAVADCERVKFEDCPKILELLDDKGWPALIEYIIELREKNGDTFNKPIGPVKKMMKEYKDALERTKHELEIVNQKLSQLELDNQKLADLIILNRCN